MKNKKLVIVLCAVLAVLIAAFAVIWHFNRPVATEGKKQIEVTVVHADGKEKEFDIKTDAEYLGDALLEKKLVTEDEYKNKFYTVIDGEEAAFENDGAWWCVTQDGEMTSVGMNEQPVKDGDEFEIAYTIG